MSFDAVVRSFVEDQSYPVQAGDLLRVHRAWWDDQGWLTAVEVQLLNFRVAGGGHFYFRLEVRSAWVWNPLPAVRDGDDDSRDDSRDDSPRISDSRDSRSGSSQPRRGG